MELYKKMTKVPNINRERNKNNAIKRRKKEKEMSMT